MRTLLPSKPLDVALAALGLALVVATVLVLVLTDDAPQEAAQGQEAVAEAAATDSVTIADFLFEPAAITVPAGTEITWTNTDGAPHTATSGTSPSADGTFDTGAIDEDETGSVVVEEPGTYAYFCKFHPTMKGTVVVE